MPSAPAPDDNALAKLGHSFRLLVAFTSDLGHVVLETEDLAELLQEQTEFRRRRLVGRLLVLNLLFMAEAVVDLHRRIGKLVFEYTKRVQSQGLKPHVSALPKDMKTRASEIAKQLGRARNIIAHPYRVLRKERTRIGVDEPEEPISLSELLLAEAIIGDVQSLLVAFSELKNLHLEIQYWLDEAIVIGGDIVSEAEKLIL